MSQMPTLVYADETGQIFDYPEFEMVGRSGNRFRRVSRLDWKPLPAGSELFLMPSRLPVGYDPLYNSINALRYDPYDSTKAVRAVAAFVAPAHTQTYSAAYQSLPGAPILPLFAYTAVGWHKGRFVAACFRVDPDQRQDLKNFDRSRIERNARRRMKKEPENRLITHLGNCAITYGCPAARNLFLGRWEAPLPTSPVCNARCLGCISLQDERKDLCATQDRITFVPSPEEVCGVAVPHLEKASRAVVSFGQGCEGEPLLQAGTLRESIERMRRRTSRGTINLNTNGSLPREVEVLRQSGLDSIRVSLNSCRQDEYNAYFRPRGYAFNDVLESIRSMKRLGGFAAINYFVLPGFTDRPGELDALSHVIEETGLDLIQARNLNADPEWYLQLVATGEEKGIGILKWRDTLKQRFPHLRFGYFNPSLDMDA